MAWEDNAALYRKMSQPFPDANAANDAVTAFMEDLKALRVKHKIPDLYIVLAITYATSDGEEARGMTTYQCGDGMRHESMVAYALGTVQADRREMVNKLISRAGK